MAIPFRSASHAQAPCPGRGTVPEDWGGQAQNAHAQPDRIYLFGSVARGDAGPDSDYDLMVVVGNDAPPALAQGKLAYQVLWGTGVAADVLVLRKSAFEGRKHIPASLPATVLREGKLLYAA